MWPVRAVAAADLVVTLPLAIPGLERRVVEAVLALDCHAGSGGGVPPMAAAHLWVLNVLGLLGVLWAAARIMRPRPLLAAADVAGRAYICALIAYYVASGGLTPAVMVFAITEVAGAALQLWWLASIGALWWGDRRDGA